MDTLVSIEWLASRLGDDNVAVLDASMPVVGVQPRVDTQARYRERHIPGAVFFDIEELSEKATTLPHMLPSAETFGRSMGLLGLRETMTLVVYEQQGVFSAPRAWWMLRAMGAQDVRVLDGGLAAWLAAGFAVEDGVVQRPEQRFHAVLQTGMLRTLAEVQTLAAEGCRQEQVLDARSSARFEGTAAEPRAGLPSGHMPGATSMPYTDLVEAGRLREPDRLRELFISRGVDLGRPITTSCGSGVTAAVLALALERSGAAEVRLYDGSWAEYARQPGALIETA